MNPVKIIIIIIFQSAKVVPSSIGLYILLFFVSLSSVGTIGKNLFSTGIFEGDSIVVGCETNLFNPDNCNPNNRKKGLYDSGKKDGFSLESRAWNANDISIPNKKNCFYYKFIDELGFQATGRACSTNLLITEKKDFSSVTIDLYTDYYSESSHNKLLQITIPRSGFNQINSRYQLDLYEILRQNNHTNSTDKIRIVSTK
ncbi:hypothetical protein [Microcoleus sp. herbarium5]|uniref:hypothetical protein n=1 Tax=Microcoleus sp. herbarium5 TaxID=3055434 RepID=UPI002FCF2688